MYLNVKGIEREWISSLLIPLHSLAPCVVAGAYIRHWDIQSYRPFLYTASEGAGRGLPLAIISSLRLIDSESLHGFCHLHLNCKIHWWWLLFHLHSFPPCPTTASFFVDNWSVCTWSNNLLIRKVDAVLYVTCKQCREFNLLWSTRECCYFPQLPISNSCCVFELFLCRSWNWGQRSTHLISGVFMRLRLNQQNSQDTFCS